MEGMSIRQRWLERGRFDGMVQVAVYPKEEASGVYELRTGVVFRSVNSSTVTASWRCVAGFSTFCSTMVPCTLYVSRDVNTVLKNRDRSNTQSTAWDWVHFGKPQRRL